MQLTTSTLAALLSLPSTSLALPIPIPNAPPVSPYIYALAIKSAHAPLAGTYLSLNTTSSAPAAPGTNTDSAPDNTEIGIFPSAPAYTFSMYHTSRSPLDKSGPNRLYTIVPRSYTGKEKVALLDGGRGRAVLRQGETPRKGDGRRWEGWLGGEGEELGYTGEEEGGWWAVEGAGGWRVERRGGGVVSTAVGQKIEIEVVRMN